MTELSSKIDPYPHHPYSCLLGKQRTLMKFKRLIALIAVLGLIWIAVVWGVSVWFTPEPEQPPTDIGEVLK